MPRRKLTQDEFDDLATSHDEDFGSNEDTSKKSKKSKKSAEPKNKPIELPVLAFGEDKSDYKDEFTVNVLKSLRRAKIDLGNTSFPERYVKYTSEDDKKDDEWLLINVYRNKQDRLVLEEHYKKANSTLEKIITDALKPIINNINENLKNTKTVSPYSFKAMVENRLPLAFLKRMGFKLEFNGDHYVVPAILNGASLIDVFIGYVLVELFDKDNSPMEEILFITNDKTQKDHARYYYNLEPSKDHFNEAPKLDDYSKAWASFLQDRFNNPRMDLLRLTHFIYGLISSECHSRQALALFDGGNTGKTTFKSALAAILPGAMTTGITLKDLAGEFTPPQINGCRGLAIDEGQALQAFFDGDFFKEVTGATDDNYIQVKNRKCKDHAPVRVGSIRFMFFTNSHITIQDTAGLTRLSPMFFKGNFGAIRSGAEIVAELKAEGKQFLQFCVDSDHYYKNVTSKNNHWYCPLIEGNGTINILTDEQFDEWYNEASEDLHFTQADLKSPSMRDRLERINMENCLQVTLNPKTGKSAVWGNIGDDEVTKEIRTELLRELFVEDPKGVITYAALSEFIRDQISDNKSQYGKTLKELGFRNEANLTARSIRRKQAFGELRKQIKEIFPSVIDGKRLRPVRLTCLTGIRFVMAPVTTSAKSSTDYDE